MNRKYHTFPQLKQPDSKDKESGCSCMISSPLWFMYSSTFCQRNNTEDVCNIELHNSAKNSGYLAYARKRRFQACKYKKINKFHELHVAIYSSDKKH